MTELEFPQSDEVIPDPIALARKWLPANDEPERPQITLSTVDADGFPNSRTVLLSEVSDDGFTIHTDSQSRKVAELSANPKVSIVVLWPNFWRQLVVQGIAEFADPTEVAAAYAARSPYLKQLAWQNTTEFAQLPLAEREAQWGKLRAEHPDGSFDQPETWVGFLVRPTRMTFWASNADAASRRAEYLFTPDGWELTFLPG